MVNLGDIAKATGFSKATVSRVLSGDPSFTAKESTRHRVIQVANELGYALRTSRSSIPLTIAVLENFDPSNGPQDSSFSNVREALRERRDLLCRLNAGKRGGRDRIHADAVEYRREGPVELQVELAVASIFGEHASTVSTVCMG